MKNNKGAISIEMILTVIVLIVLGGICIFMLTGDNGLFVPVENEQRQEEKNNIDTTKDAEQTSNADNTVNGENTAQTE